MKAFAYAAIAWLVLLGTPAQAQHDDSGGGAAEAIVVTATRRISGQIVIPPKPPLIGIRRQADSAVRNIEISSDSREEAMRKREVQAMLLDALDRAKRDGFSLVTGEFEVVEVTRANWQDQFPGLADKATTNDDEDDEDDDDDDDDDKPKPLFEDDGSTTTVRLKIKTKLNGSISAAQQAISKFVKSVPANGRAQIEQHGGLALTIVRPEQYRDELYRLIAAGAKHAASFYDPGYGLDITGLDQAIAWKQVSDTEVFLYIPYSFAVKK